MRSFFIIRYFRYIFYCSLIIVVFLDLLGYHHVVYALPTLLVVGIVMMIGQCFKPTREELEESESTISSLTIEDCEALFWLAARDYVFFSTYSGETKEHNGWYQIAVNCNDVFYYATADAEECKIEDIQKLRDLINRFGWHGLIAWVAIKRKTVPVPAIQKNQAYSDAINYLLTDTSSPIQPKA